MKLKNVSRHFNESPIYDAYTGQLLFRAHTKAHDDQSSSGATARRRTMRTVPETAHPARRAVRIDDTYWVVGNANMDSFNGKLIRKSYGLKKSTGLMTRLTPGQAALGQAGYDFHTQTEFYKDTSDPLTQSDQGVMWNIFCPYTETVVRGQFLRRGGQLFRVRNVYPTVDEYQIAESDELESDALQAATFTLNGQLDIATDTYPTVSVATTVIQTDTTKFYRFRDPMESVRQAGDIAVFVAKSALTLNTSAKFTMLGLAWRVVMVQSEDDSWAVLARRV